MGDSFARRANGSRRSRRGGGQIGNLRERLQGVLLFDLYHDVVCRVSRSSNSGRGTRRRSDSGIGLCQGRNVNGSYAGSATQRSTRAPRAVGEERGITPVRLLCRAYLHVNDSIRRVYRRSRDRREGGRLRRHATTSRARRRRDVRRLDGRGRLPTTGLARRGTQGDRRRGLTSKGNGGRHSRLSIT